MWHWHIHTGVGGLINIIFEVLLFLVQNEDKNKGCHGSYIN